MFFAVVLYHDFVYLLVESSFVGRFAIMVNMFAKCYPKLFVF